jgi:NAD+-dependent secondary alcohol dehydrogenase Adh1
LWLLGKHRVYCGSALDPLAYELLMAKERASSVFTDPPYNVKIDGNVCGSGAVRHREFAMASGEMTKEEFVRFLAGALDLVRAYASPGAIIYACMDWRHMAEMLAAGDSANFELLNLCVWVKTNGGMGSLYRSRHELVFVFRNGGEAHRNNVQLGRFAGDRTPIQQATSCFRSLWVMRMLGGSREIGKEVEGIKIGDPVIMHPKITGGTCLACRRGFDMHGPGKFPGLDSNGGYAEYLCTSERNIVQLPKTLAPKEVAPYADAGLTAYRAVKKAARQLNPGEACIIIGVGGLGHIGIQCLRAMSPADIIAVDKSDASLNLAKTLGARKLVKVDGNEVEAVLEMTDGKGAEAVIDFVGERGTTIMGLKMTRPMGSYYIVGYGEDIKIPTIDMVITERNIIGNLVGTWAELVELMALADRGLIELKTAEYKLKNANDALHDLNCGKIHGRAVLVP